jgi:predicted nucleic acid-binding protein
MGVAECIVLALEEECDDLVVATSGAKALNMMEAS